MAATTDEPGFGLTIDDSELDEIPLDELEGQITSFAGRLNAAMAAWLIWVAAFDRRRGWERWEQTSCAGWLSWKCGVDPRTGHEHVRVARALETLPLVRQLFLAGELSYSKVRALSRVADSSIEADLCDLALAATASQMESVCRGLRGRTGGSTPGWAPAVRFETFDDHGRIIIEVPIDDLRRIEATVDGAADQIIAEARQHDSTSTLRETVDALGGHSAIRVGALVGLVDGSIDQAEGPVDDVVVHVEVDQLSTDHSSEEPTDGHAHGHAAGVCTLRHEAVPPIVARRVSCDSRLQIALACAHTGETVGRAQRVVSRRLRRQVLRRDGGMCRFPGCGIRRRLQAHHVAHWADGGPTVLENLLSVCTFHHHTLHEGGWNAVNKNGRFVFYDVDGREVTVPETRNPEPDRPLPPLVPVERAGSVEPCAGWGQRFDIGWTVDNLAANAEVASRAITRSAGL